MIEKIFADPHSPILQKLKAYEKDFIKLRQEFHAHPELSREEFTTADRIEELLNQWNIPTSRISTTGVVGTITKGSGKKRIGLRADIDALPIHETSNKPYASNIDNVMHACGHDGHTTMLLIAAKYLALEADFDGTVVLVFQPDEEDTAGAKRMIDDGLFNKYPVDAIFAMHNFPGAKQGEILINHGPQMAGTCTIEIEVKGPGGHAAHPYQSIDTVLVASHIIIALQSIVSRNLSALDAAVITIGSIHGGSANNVIPNSVKLKGTLRYFDIKIRDQIKERITSLSKQTAEAFGATAIISLSDGYIPTINHDNEVDFCLNTLKPLINPEYLTVTKTPSMGAEDFGFMLHEQAGAYFYIGNNSSDKLIALHTSAYDFNDKNIIVGGAVWIYMVNQYLKKCDV